jgi:hypothetical protein
VARLGRASKEWPSMKSGWMGFKIGLQGILRRGEDPTVILYVSKILSAKCVKRKRE